MIHIFLDKHISKRVYCLIPRDRCITRGLPYINNNQVDHMYDIQYGANERNKFIIL